MLFLICLKKLLCHYQYIAWRDKLFDESSLTEDSEMKYIIMTCRRHQGSDMLEGTIYGLAYLKLKIRSARKAILT